MAEGIIQKAGGGGASDECTAGKAQVLAGYTAITRDSGDEPVSGTMVNHTGVPSKIENRRLNNGRFEVAVAQGYHGCYWAGDSYEYMELAEVASTLGLTAAKLLKGQTVCGVAGTATSDANAAASHILSGKTAYVNGAKISGSITSLAGQTVTPGNTAKTVSCSGKYMTGNVTVSPVSNLIAANIKKGVNVGGVVGTWEGYVASPTDLYYKGANPGGLSVNRLSNGEFSFEGTYIYYESLTDANNESTLKTNRSYNLAGYKSIFVEFVSLVTRPKGVRLRLYRDATGSEMLEEVVVSNIITNGTYIATIPLATHQTTISPCLGFSNYLVSNPKVKIQITRIRLG